MSMSRVAAPAALVLLLAGCAGGEDSGAGDEPASSAVAESSMPSPAPDEPRPDPSARNGTVVVTADSDYGPMLFDASGQAIYLFEKESTELPRCYGACAEAWPPVLTSGDPRGRNSARDSLLGTTRRRDGSSQVTYAGHPLYFYAHEGKHEVLCHGVSEFGGLWLVVTPRGVAAPTAG
jgi:predicted lipoprotein with Yx(FWY)xxD motif